MSGERSGKGCLIAALIWIVVFGMLATAFKYLVMPYFKEELQEETGSASQYKHEITIGLDSFSGYAVLRSDAFRKELKSKSIKLVLKDDSADYKERSREIRREKLDMAVFPLNTLIQSGAEKGEYPASIVSVIGETKGADAIVAYKEGVPNLESLNEKNAIMYLTPDSPSEFLSRIVLAHFSLPELSADNFNNEDGAEAVYQRFLNSDKDDKRVFALWEPFVSKALEEPDAHVLLDSSKLKGYIIDVMVANRKLIKDNPALIKDVVESYYKVLYSFQNKTGGLAQMVADDAGKVGERVDSVMAEKISKGIQWKNTLENYAMFGLLPKDKSVGSQHLEDCIINVSNVLVKTGALNKAPLEGKEHTLFYDGVLRKMQQENFHPGKTLNLIQDQSFGEFGKEKIRATASLEAMNDQQWNNLVPVANMNVKPISFGRGGARLNMSSKRELTRLAANLKSWDQYYILVVGHSRAEGDMDANRALAENRAKAAAGYLIEQGISKNRIKVKAAKPESSGGTAQSVRFLVGEKPY